MRNYLFVSLFLGLLSLSSAALACINIYGTNSEGESVLVEDHGGHRLRSLSEISIDKQHWKEREAALAVGLDAADYQHRTDYAAALIFLGRVEEAIPILEQVEKEKSGEYIVAANLGTAYELHGEVDKSIEWIQKGIERNPDSHGGSEWVHIKVLEAKQQLVKDPNWLKTHSVLGVDFGSEAAIRTPASPVKVSSEVSLDLRGVAHHVEYQLQERLKFVSPKEPLVADLLFDLGNLIAITGTVEEALPFYRFAKRYGYRDPDLLKSRMEHIQGLVDSNPVSGVRDTSLYVAIGLIAFTSVVIILVVWYRRRKMLRESLSPSLGGYFSDQNESL